MTTTECYDVCLGTTVLRVNATDLDILQNALITYYLGSGGKDNFGIDSNDGSLYILPNRSLVVDHPPTYYNITVIYEQVHLKKNIAVQVMDGLKLVRIIHLWYNFIT